jgi:hypothetical protein
MAFVVDFRGEATGACSGTVLAPDLVLTAGHCALDPATGVTNEAAGYRVVTGAVNWTSAERQVSRVSRVLVFPGFRISGTLNEWGDAALLVLSTPATAPTIPLATSTNAERLRAGTHAWIAGWGKTQYRQEEPVVQLMWATTVVHGPPWCERHAPPFHPVGQICSLASSDPPSGTCFGDSGGPLLVAGPGGQGLVEIGILSSGYDHCSTREPHVYTRADLIAHWAHRWISALNPSSTPPPHSRPPDPAMSNPLAEAIARQALLKAIGTPFQRRSGYTVRCRPINSTRRGCSVYWFFRAKLYYGGVTPYLLKRGEPPWNARSTISWVTDRCYFHTNRKHCTVHTRRG